MEGILFIRKYPACMANGRFSGIAKCLKSVLGANGYSETTDGHKVTFFFPGYGKTLAKNILADIACAINAGEISDIVDFGGAGALDRGLRMGDLILSCGEICDDATEFCSLQRRPETVSIVQKMALEAQHEFWCGKILTSSRIVAKRQDRLDWCHKTKTVAVQMEHGWLLRRIQQAVNPKAFERLRVTHVELIIDQVPHEETGKKAIWTFLCNLRKNHQMLEGLKTKFLKEFCQLS